MAGAIGASQGCSVYVENALFLGCSSSKGGVLSISERSSVIIIKTNFTNNFAESGGILQCYENYGSNITIESSIFVNNSCDENLFILMNAKLYMFDCEFQLNKNIIFSLSKANLTLNHISIYDNTCANKIIGCLINSIDNSNILADDLILTNISNILEEGNIYLENSLAIFSQLFMNKSTTLKNIGCCIMSMQSKILLDFGYFANYDDNCIYAVNSFINITNSVFENRNSEVFFTEKSGFKLGSVYCDVCFELFISNDSFFYNMRSSSGSCIYISDSLEEANENIAWILNSSFMGNIASDKGGAIYIEDFNAIILNSSFKNNQASFGAAIYFFSYCNFVYFLKKLIFLFL